MNSLLSLHIRIYSLLLRLYPRSFQTAFGEEMHDVYAAAAAEAARKGLLPLFGLCLRELLDLPPHLLEEHAACLKHRWRQHQAHAQMVSDRSSSWTATLAGMLLFLVAGLELALGEISHHDSLFGWLPTLRIMLLSGLLVLPAVGFGVGWIQNFPRWSYPYVMLMVMFSLYLMNVTTPESRTLTHTVGDESLWGWRAWIPAAFMAAVGIGVSRSLHPAVRLFANVWEDWTLLTWGMFGTMPLLMTIGFDEVDRLYSLPYMIFLTAVMSGTAVVYLRSRYAWQQLAALLVGIVVTVGVVAVAPTFYWLENGWGHLPSLMLGTMIVVAAMFSPVFIGLLHRALTYLRPA